METYYYPYLLLKKSIGEASSPSSLLKMWRLFIIGFLVITASDVLSKPHRPLITRLLRTHRASAPVATNEPQTRPPEIWLATTLHFTDDYKARGDWASLEDVATFDNEESARRHQAQRMISFLNYREDVLQSGPKDEVRDFFVETAEGWLLRDWKDAEKAVEPYLDGEFIERRMIWTLRQIPLQTSHPLSDLTQANEC